MKKVKEVVCESNFSFGFKLVEKDTVKGKRKQGVIKLLHNQKGHNKFYNITLKPGAKEAKVELTYGRVGNTGTSITKEFGTLNLAQKFINYQLKEKLKKGYEEVLPKPKANSKTLAKVVKMKTI